MMTASKSLLALTALDLMSPTVVTVPQDMSLRGAAHRLAQADVSGAPVVDGEGRCVGVISSRDFVGWADRGERAAKHDTAADCYCAAWQIMAADTLPCDMVERYMTADPVTVAPGTLVGSLARMMVDARIHRLIVLDHAHRPIGVVSSTDVLAAVARAARDHGDSAAEDYLAAAED